jgi:hypothetical protein
MAEVVIPEDAALWNLNETELLERAKFQGIGRLRRGLGKGLLLAIVAGYERPTQAHLSDTTYTRGALEQFIWANIERTRSQLPGCDGHCTTYKCSDGRHGLCFLPHEVAVQ